MVCYEGGCPVTGLESVHRCKSTLPPTLSVLKSSFVILNYETRLVIESFIH